MRRGTKSGHTYHLLAYGQGPVKLFEPFLITMNDDTEHYPVFQHPGTEFLYMLEGRMEYRHGQHTYLLTPGDALSFRGEVPHGPGRAQQRGQHEEHPERGLSQHRRPPTRGPRRRARLRATESSTRAALPR